MSFWNALLLGIVQGISEFLPVSSFGNLTLLESLLGVERRTGVLVEILLHFGTAMSIVVVFRRDFCRIFKEFLGIGADLIGNIHIFLHNRQSQEADLPYSDVVEGTWRKLTALVVLSAFPTAVLGYVAKRLVTVAALSPFLPGACMLLTAVILLVTDLGQVGEKRAAREAAYDCAMWMGICQGLAVFPGISRSAVTICAGLFCGLRKKFVVKFTYIMSVPAVLGALVLELDQFRSPQLSASLLGFTLLASFLAFLVGLFCLRPLLKITGKVRLRWFAICNAVIGILALVRSFG